MSMSERFYLLPLYFAITLVFYGCGDHTQQSPGEPRVIMGENLFEKTPLYQAKTKMHSINDITPFDPGSGLVNQIGIVGAAAMHIVDSETGVLNRVVQYDAWPGGIVRSEVVNVQEDGSFEILVRSHLSKVVGLMNKDGKPLWEYRLKHSFGSTLTAGDVDRDGRMEFYLADSDGLHRFDRHRTRIWKSGDWLGNVHIYDPGENKEPLIVTLRTYRGEHIIQLWNSEGELIRDIKPEIKIYWIEPCQWPYPGHILTYDHSTLYVLDSNGGVVFKHSLKESIFGIRGTAVKFSEKQAPHFAVLTKYSSTTGRSTLCIFSPEGELIYEELLRSTTGLLALRTKSSEGEVLLVGCGHGRVCKYRLEEQG